MRTRSIVPGVHYAYGAIGQGQYRHRVAAVEVADRLQTVEVSGKRKKVKVKMVKVTYMNSVTGDRETDLHRQPYEAEWVLPRRLSCIWEELIRIRDERNARWQAKADASLNLYVALRKRIGADGMSAVPDDHREGVVVHLSLDSANKLLAIIETGTEES